MVQGCTGKMSWGAKTGSPSTSSEALGRKPPEKKGFSARFRWEWGGKGGGERQEKKKCPIMKKRPDDAAT